MLASVGIGTEPVWQAIRSGQSGIGPITAFDATDFSCRIAGEVKGFDPANYIEKKEIKKMGRFIQLAIAASDFALQGSGFKVPPGEEAERTGVYIGSGIGGFEVIEREHKILLEKGPSRISPFFIPATIINLASGYVSIRTGAKGPNSATATACTSGAHAIGDSFRLIQRGDADVMICGGAEAAITPMGIGGFAAMRALSHRNDEPERASRPWDRDRDGFVVGEGSGILILEEYEHAVHRGAPMLAEMVGYGMSGDAYHITSPSEDGDGGFRVMRNALKDAGIEPDQIDYVNAHGTSTPVGDRIETIAMKRVFGDHAYEGRRQLHQVHDRAPAGRRRRARGRHHRPGHPRPDRAAHHQLRKPRPGLRSGLRAESGAADEDRLRAVEFVRLRRHQRLPDFQKMNDSHENRRGDQAGPLRDSPLRIDAAGTWIEEEDLTSRSTSPTPMRWKKRCS